jgi:hypothetical protein
VIDLEKIAVTFQAFKGNPIDLLSKYELRLAIITDFS